jgi:phospholipase/carboxylesterase
MLETVELQTGDPVRFSVIWLHGLGADGHDFEPIAPALRLHDYQLRFVFPHAPVRPVTVNAGIPMRAWYDVAGLERNAIQDEAGIRDSESQVRELILRENDRGIPAERIVLAGFSQGGAIALRTALCYPERLAGIIGLSTYLPLRGTFDDEAHEANARTPVFMAHGTLDPLLPASLGEESRDFLQARSYDLEWKTYPMAHAVCPEEVIDVRDWLRRTLS